MVKPLIVDYSFFKKFFKKHKALPHVQVSVKADIYDEYVRALKLCSSEILKLSDDDLEYLILEDLELEYSTTFDEGTLDYLLNEHLINAKEYKGASDLRVMIGNLIGTSEKKNAKAFREDPEWQAIYQLSDKMLSELN